MEDAEKTRAELVEEVKALRHRLAASERSAPECAGAAASAGKGLTDLLLDSLPHFAMLIRKDRTVLAANRAARELGARVGGHCWRDFGRSEFIPEEDKKYVNDHQKVPHGGTHCVFCRADEAFRDGQPRNSPEIRAWERIWDTYWVPLDEDTYLHYAIDITARKGMEEELRQSQKLQAVGKLAGGIAHEFNNILMGISGYAYLLRKDVEETSQTHRDLTTICEQAERAAELTRQLLAFSRRQMLAPIVLDLNAVLSEAAEMWRQLIGAHIELKLELAAGLWNVRADCGQIEQVMLKLILNARDAMPEGGTLTIETANVPLDRDDTAETAVVAGPCVMIAVTDTGHGMDDATRERVFDPFFTSKDVGEGVGLGLSMVYGTIKQHKGHVAVRSGPGEGTTLRIYLPSVAAETRAEAPEPRLNADTRGTETLLVVDDTDVVRVIVGRLLRRQGYKVLTAASAAEAKALFHQPGEAIALLLADVVMPGGSGLDLYRDLAAEVPGLKVIFMSGHSDEVAARRESARSGMPFIRKPIEPADLVGQVRAVLDT